METRWILCAIAGTTLFFLFCWLFWQRKLKIDFSLLGLLIFSLYLIFSAIFQTNIIMFELNWLTFLEYFKVLCSWPPVVLIMFIIVIKTFRDPIAGWIKNFRVKYGDTEFSSQASRGDDDSEVEIAGAQQVDQSVPAAAKEPSQKSLETVAQWRAAAYLWEYRYLNRFLAFHTQQYLDWLSGFQTPIVYGAADALWNLKIPDPKERKAVLDALEQHYLITIEDAHISITEKGKEYVHVRGPVTPAFPELEALAKKK